MQSFVISPHETMRLAVLTPSVFQSHRACGDCCRSMASVSQEPLGFAVLAACERGGYQRAGRRLPMPDYTKSNKA